MKNFIRHFFIQFVSILACLAIVGVVLLVVRPRLGGHGKPAEAAPEVKEAAATVELDEFTVNLADTDRGRYLKITVVLAVPDEAAAHKVEEFKPQIQDAIISTLTRQYYHALQSPQGKDQLKADLKKETEGVLHGAGVPVLDVLFVQFVMQ